MNTKVVYAAGIVILLIGIAFYFINSGFFPSENSVSSVNNSKTNPNDNTVESSSPSSNSNIAVSGQESNKNNPNQNQQPQQKKVSSNYDNLIVGVKSIDIVPVNNVSKLQISFSVYNPNRGAAILETLSYGVYFDNVRLASADIGSKPEGFIDSLSSVYPIIGNQTITLKDAQTLSEDGSALLGPNGTLTHNSASTSNSSLSTGKTISKSFVINGTASTSLHRGTESQSSETPFNLQFPLKQ
jgi:hypothetical protein